MTERLGEIAVIQVQRMPLKTGRGFDPAPLLGVDRAWVGPAGVAGFSDGGWVLDVHHSAHPASRGGGRRAVSIGFTGHYRSMEDRFGSVPVGCAGENLIVAADRRLDLEDLAPGLVIGGRGGDLVLGSARVAAPCREFTSFLRGSEEVLPREAIAADLEFLGGGTRGFIVEAADGVEIGVGDPVFLAQSG